MNPRSGQTLRHDPKKAADNNEVKLAGGVRLGCRPLQLLHLSGFIKQMLNQLAAIFCKIN
jgi:hypothetical protein